MVEELDTQLDIQEAPSTPPRIQPEKQMPTQSPGAASQMSGTTAMSSFSMTEAESLEPKYITKHLRKLCDAAGEFLEHLVPDNAIVEEDLQHIQDMQMPDAEFTEEYRDFETELEVHLRHFMTENHEYIHLRAIHRALFGENREVAAAHSGLDLILYLANILVFGKEMIYSDRSDKVMWDVLRTLDNTFPSQFVPALNSDARPTAAGESTLLQATFALALELRTQLAILVLERASIDKSFNPDETLREVFFRSEASQEVGGSVLRGWNAVELGGYDAILPEHFDKQIVERLENMRKFFHMDDASLEQEDMLDLEGLSSNFPWEATVLRMLHWVRLRHRELHAAIEELGGPTTILQNVKREMDGPQRVTEQAKVASVPPESPRRKRTSFRRESRRGSRKFDPNTPVDVQAIDALKARERLLEVNARQAQEEQSAQPIDEEAAEELPVNQGSCRVSHNDQEAVNALGARERRSDGSRQAVVDDVHIHSHIVDSGGDDQQPAIGGEEIEPPIEQLKEQPEERLREHTAEQDEEDEQLGPIGPPTSSAALLKVLKEVTKPEKENRTMSFFDRQPNAQRVEFGDGFDTQPTPGPSTQSKGKQPVQSSPSRKRPRPVDIDTDSEDEVFESEDRTARAEARRQQAPVTKKVRINPTPTSSNIPTSAQPHRPSQPADDDDYQPARDQEDSISENEAPDMTEEAPPSSYQAQHRLALQNRNIIASQRDRKPRTAWSIREEEAFVEYMSMYPGKYAAIQTYDREEGGHILEARTQVNLKDKARTMAINMIK